MSETAYDKLEAKALKRIETEKALAEEALARHNQMTGQGA